MNREEDIMVILVHQDDGDLKSKHWCNTSYDGIEYQYERDMKEVPLIGKIYNQK